MKRSVRHHREGWKEHQPGVIDCRFPNCCLQLWQVPMWLVQLVGRGQALVEPECTASAADPDPCGSRLRGWNFYGGKELRGCYCVLPQPRTNSSPSMEEAARAGAHQDPPPKHLVACALLESVPAGGGGMAVRRTETCRRTRSCQKL